MDATDLLRAIGRSLARLRRADGDEIRLLAVHRYDRFEFDCTVGVAQGLHMKVDPLSVPSDIETSLAALRQEMIEAEGEVWSRCVYVLKPDGTYHLGIDYGPESKPEDA